MIHDLFTKKIFLYDNDFTGIDISNKLSEKYGWENRIMECEYKDVFEFYTSDEQGCKTYIKELIE